MQSSDKELRELGHLILDQLVKYLNESRSSQEKVVDLGTQKELQGALKIQERIDQGFDGREDILSFVDTYLQNSMHLHNPKYLGHQVAVPHMASALAEVIHGVANQPVSIYEMGPSANIIEQEVIQWMLEKLGWTAGGGVLTHGGSLANLHCMLSARAALDPDAWAAGNGDDIVVLAPESSHYSIARAMGIMGLGQTALVPIPTDANEVVICAEIERLILELRTEGKRIMAVVINTCATSTGLYDPVDRVADVCAKYGIWLHLDSPHGITALLSERYRPLLGGIHRADSVVWDAHKMMRTSTLCTAVLIRSRKSFQQTFAQKASYLIHEKETANLDMIPYQIECTKSGLGSKLFWILAAEGAGEIAKYLEGTFDLAREAYDLICQRPKYECPYVPQSNILCFRYRADQVDQLELREKLVADGQFYITSTEIKSIRYLRIVIMNEFTTIETIASMLDRLEALAGD